MRVTARASALIAAAAAGLAFVATAGTTIVPQHSIAGVSLGMTQAQVRAKLGTPLKVKHAKNEFGTYTTFRYANVTVTFQGDANVTGLMTTSASERTASGLGVGSTRAQLRAKLPALKCAGSTAEGDCHLGAFLPGKTVTDFFIVKGKVVTVEVGYVID